MDLIRITSSDSDTEGNGRRWNHMNENHRKGRFEVIYQENYTPDMSKKMIFVDKETGVNYLFVQECYAGGVTPLLGAEGELILNKNR